MKIIIITQDDPFYICEFLELFLAKAQATKLKVSLIAVLPPFGESLFDLIKRMYDFYGLIDFVRRCMQYVWLLSLDKVGIIRRSVTSIAKKYRIPVKKILDVNAPEFISSLRSIAPDIILSVSAPQIFRKELLGVPKWGCVNIHCAKLPKYRGMMPNFWAMYHGDSIAGITIHTMDEKIDRGKIIVQSEIPIFPGESLDSLIKRSKRAAADLVIQALVQIKEGKVQLRDYEENGSYFSFPKPEHVRKLRERGHRLL